MLNSEFPLKDILVGGGGEAGGGGLQEVKVDRGRRF